MVLILRKIFKICGPFPGTKVSCSRSKVSSFSIACLMDASRDISASKGTSAGIPISGSTVDVSSNSLNDSLGHASRNDATSMSGIASSACMARNALLA